MSIARANECGKKTPGSNPVSSRLRIHMNLQPYRTVYLLLVSMTLVLGLSSCAAEPARSAFVASDVIWNLEMIVPGTTGTESITMRVRHEMLSDSITMCFPTYTNASGNWIIDDPNCTGNVYVGTKSGATVDFEMGPSGDRIRIQFTFEQLNSESFPPTIWLDQCGCNVEVVATKVVQ